METELPIEQEAPPEGEGRAHEKRHQGIDVAEKARQAMELRRAGWSYEAIALRLKYSNRSAARQAIKRWLIRTVREPADEVRQLELERLDRLQAGLWQRALGLVKGQTGPDLQAVDRVLAISRLRAALMGLNAPTKLAFVTDEDIERMARDRGLDPEQVAELAERIANGKA